MKSMTKRDAANLMSSMHGVPKSARTNPRDSEISYHHGGSTNTLIENNYTNMNSQVDNAS